MGVVPADMCARISACSWRCLAEELDGQPAALFVYSSSPFQVRAEDGWPTRAHHYYSMLGLMGLAPP